MIPDLHICAVIRCHACCFFLLSSVVFLASSLSCCHVSSELWYGKSPLTYRCLARSHVETIHHQLDLN